MREGEKEGGVELNWRRCSFPFPVYWLMSDMRLATPRKVPLINTFGFAVYGRKLGGRVKKRRWQSCTLI